MNCQNDAYTSAVAPIAGSGGQNGFPVGKIVRDAQGRAIFDNLETNT